MKKMFMPIALLLSAAFIFSGCVSSHSLYYDFDELMQGLVRAEIIYMENRVNFFVIHSYVDVEEINYESVRELTCDETEMLIRGLSNVEFTYTILWVPHSVIFDMQGYAIKLHYESAYELSNGREPFIIIAQTGDYGYRMRRFGQVRAGRMATDEDWNILMSELYFERRLLPALRPTVFRTIAAIYLISSITLLTGLGSFLLTSVKFKDKNEKYHIKAVSKFMGRILLALGILALIADGFVWFWFVVLFFPLILAIMYAKMSKRFRKTDVKYD